MEINKITCSYCNKEFSTNQTRNRHVRKFHSQKIESATKTKTRNHIICPLCLTGNFCSLIILETHIEEHHSVKMEYKEFNFNSFNEYKAWMNEEKIEVNYSILRTRKLSNYSQVFYACNRSNYRGFKPNYQKRTEKAGGSIKIQGVCPSRYIINKLEEGKIVVTFQAIHVGHGEMMKAQHLSNSEKSEIVEKLKLGVTTDRILKDTKKEIGRISLLKRQDIHYLKTKYNINEMVAVTLKVQEWNSNGKNYAFLFKQQGENHEVLRDSDFVVAFMNSTMRSKLVNYSNIIGVDGTHGTNKKGLELTTVLVKDDNNAGFPVAFLLSNRSDQIVQEVFLGALKDTVGKELKPNYLMTDDDPKYHNAWERVMGHVPQRLLCTWHVMKNWNIQGRSKIKNPDIKKQMKVEMKKILNEINEELFHEKVTTYFKKLENSSEVEFLNYLKKYYFQNHNRMKMWAHCYRVNVGVNTNMPVDSLNNFLKSNLLKRRANISLEKLLDTLDELVNFKMWQRTIKMERPDASNYQDRIVIQAHERAEQVKSVDDIVCQIELGIFKVKSLSSDRFYSVKFNTLCDKECRKLFCRVCKICYHRYSCECLEYTVRTTLCKHVHLVCMYQGTAGTNSFSYEAVASEKEFEIRKQHLQEVTEFIENNKEKPLLSRAAKMEILNKQMLNLDEENFRKLFDKFMKDIEKIEKEKTATNKKRTMDNQKYYSTKRQKL